MTVDVRTSRLFFNNLHQTTPVDPNSPRARVCRESCISPVLTGAPDEAPVNLSELDVVFESVLLGFERDRRRPVRPGASVELAVPMIADYWTGRLGNSLKQGGSEKLPPFSRLNLRGS